MTKLNKKFFKEIFATIVISAIMVISFCLCLELELLFRTEKKVNHSELNIENLSKFCTIEQLEKRLKKEPQNYIIQIKLASIHESLHQYDEAKKLYENALNISNRSNYSLFSYAMFCARRGLFAYCATLGEELSGTNKKIIEYKAKIYETMADNLDKEDQIEASVKAYQVAYKYAKSLKNTKYKNLIRDKYSLEYAKLADLNIKEKDTQEAILNLKNSLKIKDTTLARYKLGLIYQNINNAIAEKYISEVFRKDPFIVNPYIYNSVLNTLIQEATLSGKQNSADYYTLKLNRFKERIKNIYVYKDDITIDNIHVITEKKLFSSDINYYLVFALKNNTNQKLEHLFLEVELFINNRKYTINKKITVADFDNIKIKLPQEAKFNNLHKNDIISKFYIRKKDKAPWTLSKIELINF